MPGPACRARCGAPGLSESRAQQGHAMHPWPGRNGRISASGGPFVSVPSAFGPSSDHSECVLDGNRSERCSLRLIELQNGQKRVCQPLRPAWICHPLAPADRFCPFQALSIRHRTTLNVFWTETGRRGALCSSLSYRMGKTGLPTPQACLGLPSLGSGRSDFGFFKHCRSIIGAHA